MIKYLVLTINCDNPDKMKKYWKSIVHQVKNKEFTEQENEKESHQLLRNINKKINPNLYAELYFKNSYDLYKIFKNLSNFIDFFKFSIKKDYVEVNCISDSRIFLIYLKLRNSNSLYKFYQRGDLYINAKKLVNQINHNKFENSMVKIVFKKNSLNISTPNIKYSILNDVSSKNLLNQIPTDGLKTLNYNCVIMLNKYQLKEIVSNQEKSSNLFKISITDGSILFPLGEQSTIYIRFSLKDIKNVLPFLSKKSDYLKMYAEVGKPLKIQIFIRQLGKSDIAFYFSPHI